MKAGVHLRVKLFGFLLLLACFASTPSHGGTETMTNGDDLVRIDIELELAPEYVVGLPVLAVITAWVDSPGTTVRMLTEPGLLSLQHAVAVELRAAGSKEILHTHSPQPVLDLEHRRPSLDLSHGERRRWLVDLSEVGLDVLKEAGAYDVTVRYVTSHIQSATASQRAQFRFPNEEEQAWIDAQRNTFKFVETWGEWVREPPESKPLRRNAELKSKPPVPEAARLHAFLRFLIHDERALDKLSIPPLETVAPIAQPEARTILMELNLSRGDTDGARTIAEQLRAEVPDLSSLIDQIERGGGLVRSHRGLP